MTPSAHLAALARTEFTLLLRSKANLVNVLVLPLMLVVSMKLIMDQLDLAAAGLSLGPVMISSSAGIILLMALYAPLTGIYVMRREQLILKRLRSGEISDVHVLLGAATPVGLVAPLQFLVVAVAISAMASGTTLAHPVLPVLGIVLGVALTSALAAVTTLLARTAENVQIAILPGILLLPLTAGTYVPLEVFPDGVQDVLRFFPLTPVTELVRAGWGDGMSVQHAAVAVLTLLVWTALAVLGVRRWFRWEPRT
jgi:ABC-2 type transport system permease protein